MTKRDLYPIVQIDECIDFLVKAVGFSILEANSGYWHVEVGTAVQDKDGFHVLLWTVQICIKVVWSPECSENITMCIGCYTVNSKVTVRISLTRRHRPILALPGRAQSTSVAGVVSATECSSHPEVENVQLLHRHYWLHLPRDTIEKAGDWLSHYRRNQRNDATIKQH